jgi:hypothetical protein
MICNMVIEPKYYMPQLREADGMNYPHPASPDDMYQRLRRLSYGCSAMSFTYLSKGIYHSQLVSSFQSSCSGSRSLGHGVSTPPQNKPLFTVAWLNLEAS